MNYSHPILGDNYGPRDAIVERWLREVIAGRKGCTLEADGLRIQRMEAVRAERLASVQGRRYHD